MYVPHFVYPFIISGLLGCFYLLAVNIGGQVFEFLLSVVSGIYLDVKWLDHMVILCLIF